MESRLQPVWYFSDGPLGNSEVCVLGRFPPAEAGTPYPEDSLGNRVPVVRHVAELRRLSGEDEMDCRLAVLRPGESVGVI
jgi:hypothetical protein